MKKPVSNKDSNEILIDSKFAMKKLILSCCYLLFVFSLQGYSATELENGRNEVIKLPSFCKDFDYTKKEEGVNFFGNVKKDSEIGDTFFYNLKTWKEFDKYYRSENNRKLAVFMDGTRNTAEDSTNIRNLYKMAVGQACKGKPIIPYYDKGVGTHRFFDPLFGGAYGTGADLNIRQAYQFLSQTYKEGDEVYIFGFSRGAFTARSLNGFIEFAGLLDATSLEKTPTVTNAYKWEDINDAYIIIQDLYRKYLTSHDGTVDFEKRLKSDMQEFREENFSQFKFNDVKVKAIGVFDTVPARKQMTSLSLTKIESFYQYITDKFIMPSPLDDEPDNHRLDLYAERGFHALSLDEQRNDFRLFRFNELNIKSSKEETTLTGKEKKTILEEVWFPGVHSDIGGGYSTTMYCQTNKKDDNAEEENYLQGLSATPLNWMLSKFQDTELFPEQVFAECRDGILHDHFYDWIFKHRGLYKRKPNPGDKIHESIVDRINGDLRDGYWHPKREPDKKYTPLNIKYIKSDSEGKNRIDKDFYEIVFTIPLEKEDSKKHGRLPPHGGARVNGKE